MSYPSSQPPARFPSGVSLDEKYGPLAGIGIPSPVFYHQFMDDFDAGSLGVTSYYTKTAASSGGAVLAAGDGGRALFSTAATNNDVITVQTPIAGFTLPQVATAGKKLSYGVRLQLGDITACQFIAGLINQTTTPFTAGQITDGIYFQKSSGGAVLNIVQVNTSVVVTTAIPAASYALANATDIDLSFHINPAGAILVFVGAPLFGWVPPAGTGTQLPVRGPCLRLTPALTTAALAPTLGIQAGAVAIKTMNVDFHFAMKER